MTVRTRRSNASSHVRNQPTSHRPPPAPPPTQLPRSTFVSTGAFLTRGVLKRLTENSQGFAEELHAYRPNQEVMVRQANGAWHPARLQTIQDGKVLAQFTGDNPDLSSEWLRIDSPRLKAFDVTGHIHQPTPRKRGRPKKPKAPSRAVAGSTNLSDLLTSALRECSAASKAETSAPAPRYAHAFTIPPTPLRLRPDGSPQPARQVLSLSGRLIIQSMFKTKAWPTEPSALANATGVTGAMLDTYVAVPPFELLPDYRLCFEFSSTVRVRDHASEWRDARITTVQRDLVSITYGHDTRNARESFSVTSPRIHVPLRTILRLWAESTPALVDATTPVDAPAPCTERPAGASPMAYPGKLQEPRPKQSPPVPGQLMSLLEQFRSSQYRHQSASKSPSTRTLAKGDVPALTGPEPADLTSGVTQALTSDSHDSPLADDEKTSFTVPTTDRQPPVEEEVAHTANHSPPISALRDTLHPLPATLSADGTLASSRARLPASPPASMNTTPESTPPNGAIHTGRLIDTPASSAHSKDRRTRRSLQIAPAVLFPEFTRSTRSRSRATLPATPVSASQSDTTKAVDDDLPSTPSPSAPARTRKRKKPISATRRVVAIRTTTGRSPVTSSSSTSSSPGVITDPVDRAVVMPVARSNLPPVPAPNEPYDAHWTIYCNVCEAVIRQRRFYCTYCENPSDGFDYESFELCVTCFEHRFPTSHQHPRSSFAEQWLLAPADPAAAHGANAVDPTLANLLTSLQAAGQPTIRLNDNGEMVQSFEKDRFDTAYREGDLVPFVGASRGILKRKVCAFCLDDESSGASFTGPFIGPHPFTFEVKAGTGPPRIRRFWAHDGCARYSPEVVEHNGDWYNVSVALKRGRQMRCIVCRERGATIGCFNNKCQRSYHLACTLKPASYFRKGVIFWCPQHESHLNDREEYEDVFNCDQCAKGLRNDPEWYTCGPCGQDYFSSYDLCTACFASPQSGAHAHGPEVFVTTSWQKVTDTRRAEEEARRSRRAARVSSSHRYRRPGGVGSATADGTFSRIVAGKLISDPTFHSPLDGLDEAALAELQCSYCPNFLAEGWRRGYGGMIMCKDCHELITAQLRSTAPASAGGGIPTPENVDPTAGAVEGVLAGNYAAPLDEYNCAAYFTRSALTTRGRVDPPAGEVRELESLGPSDIQLFSLPVDSTYFDIPGRAPRWATHSGSDYHGTWLPQTVRRALLRYTRPYERVLSNFLGRGTDAIESLLLRRRCVGIDINPLAVERSKRNCSFRVPLDRGITAEHRPVIFLGDARYLTGPGLDSDTFDHVLSHPPYKNCVLYSQHIEGDLSRFPGSDQFLREMELVIRESWRLLKPDRRVTLGIGDNRKECFYVPVSFDLFRCYLDNGFELEELIIKRQRYCSAFGLGTELCTKYDFLMFTHEFLATFRKVVPCRSSNAGPRPLALPDLDELAVRFLTHATLHQAVVPPPEITVRRTLRTIPSSPIVRTSRPMGTVWTFKPSDRYTLSMLCLSRLVERFGADDADWEEVDLALVAPPRNGAEETIGVAVPHTTTAQTPIPPPSLSTVPPSPALVWDSPEAIESGLALPHPDLVDSDDQITSDSDLTDSASDTEKNSEELSYEAERLRKIQENRKALMSMGLISDLNDDVADDIPHYNLMTSMPARGPIESGSRGVPTNLMWLIALPHLPATDLSDAMLPGYRRLVVETALDALNRLADSGVFIVGAQDYRSPVTGKLWPLAMLLLEDINGAVRAYNAAAAKSEAGQAARAPPAILRLREIMVAVPEGYSKDRQRTYGPGEFPEETCILDSPTPVPHVPIVHAYYLVFRKRPAT